MNSAFVAGEIASTTDANSGKDNSFTYLACCAALGLLVSVVSTAVTPPEWLPEYAAWESSPARLDVAKIEIPAGLPSGGRDAH